MPNYNVPPEHLFTLQQMFEKSAKELPMVLAGCTFEWKPGKKDVMKTTFSTYKKLIVDQIKAVKAADDSPGNSTPPTQTPWKSAQPTASAVIPKPIIGTNRSNPLLPPQPPQPQTQSSGWKSAIPQTGRGGVTMGTQRVPPGVVEKLTGLLTSLSKTSTGSALTLLQEGIGIGTDQAKDAVLSELANLVDISEVLSAVAGDAAKDVAFEIAAALPFVGAALGIASNIKGAAVHSFNAGLKQLTIRSVRKNADVVTSGNASDALNGIIELLQRKRNDELWKGSLEAAHGAARGVALAGDAGALGTTGGAISSAVGLAAGLVKAALNLVHAIIRSIIDLKEMYAGSKLLQFPGEIKAAQLVNDCPLLCCYLITEAEASALLGFLSEGRYSANWMDEVEQLMPKIREIQRIANVCEREAPYILKANNRYYGNPTNGVLKSHSYLSDRVRDLPAQIKYDIEMRLKKDPNSLPFATKMWFEKLKTMASGGPASLVKRF